MNVIWRKGRLIKYSLRNTDQGRTIRVRSLVAKPAMWYVVFFALLLSRAWRGVGQYWDWVFPYFSSQTGTFFSRAAEAWTRDANGSPLGYSSDYFLRFVVSLFRFVPTELLLFLLLLGIFVAGSMGVYLIARRHIRPWLAWLLGAVAMVNPTIFYKFTAGHIDYLVSFVLFIYLIYYLLYRFRPTIRYAVMIGLMLALIGAQIQFFAIAGALIGLYFVLRPEQWRWRFAAVLLGLPLLINAVWLSNFIFGGADIASISGEATKASFRATSSSDYLNIFSFSFSKATLITRFYGGVELLLYGLVFVLTVAVILRARRKQAEDVWLLAFLLGMVFLATGLFQMINLGPATTLYPMFREVGHFAPVVVLVMIVLLGRLMPRGVLKWLCAGWFVVAVVLSFAKFQTSTQSLNFAAVRQQFAEFKQFGDSHPDDDHRVLSYPFFDQYAFTRMPISFADNLPMRNSGHDSFAAFNSEQFIKNAIKPQDFKNSLQYRLLQTLDVDVLRPYNVRYLYDFSDIYQSYYERYVPATTYDNDQSLIKNIPGFFDQLLAANPDKLKRVSPHILEVVQAQSRVAAADRIYSVDSQSAEDARSFMHDTHPEEPFDYVTSDTANVPRGSGSITPLFADVTSNSAVDVRTKSLHQTVSAEGNSTLYTSASPNLVTYTAHRGVLTFFAASSGKLYANGQLLSDNDATPVRQLAQMSMARGQQYFAGIDGSIVPIKPEGSGRIGRVKADSILELYTTASPNLITNPSFETSLWDEKVGDCSAYDKRPDIAMQPDSSTASEGKRSLQLTARRHDACTSTSMPLKGSTTYLLGYDFQSPNAQTASFYLRFNDSDKDAIKRFQGVAGSQWQSTLQLITTPEDTTRGQLFVHALASNSAEATVNRYDNFNLVELQKLADVAMTSVQSAAYTQFSQPISGKTEFLFVESSYDYANVVRNGSFESGPWQQKVDDCNKYDNSPSINMKLDRSHTEGKQSLQLEATRHVACTSTNVGVQPGMDYVLSFDYQGDGASQAGYYASFDGAQSGSQQQIAITDRSWHTYRTKVHVPEVTSNIRLFLHAYESNGSAKNIVRFDNVQLVAVPAVDKQFYVVSQPSQPLTSPRTVTSQSQGSSKRTIKIQRARGPFVLTLSESYHPGWRLELDDAHLHGAGAWVPTAQVAAVGDHFKINNYANAWHIDPATLCTDRSSVCQRQADGSYDIDLVAEFVPQRWFAINRFISVGTLLVSIGYLAATHRRDPLEEGVYQHPQLRHRLTRRKK